MSSIREETAQGSHVTMFVKDHNCSIEAPISMVIPSADDAADLDSIRRIETHALLGPVFRVEEVETTVKYIIQDSVFRTQALGILNTSSGLWNHQRN